MTHYTSGQGTQAIKNLVIQNMVERDFLKHTGLKAVPGSGQLLDIPTQAAIILGVVSTEAEVTAIRGTGNALGTAAYDSGLYTALSNFFGGG